MIKLAFTADLHLGQVQYGLSFRAEDYAKAAASVVSEARRLDCDYLVLGGDVFHSPRPPVDAVGTVKNMVESFETSRHRVLSIDGNHDNTDGKWLKLCGCVSLPNHLVYGMGSADGSVRCNIAGIHGGSVKQIFEDLDELLNIGALDKAEILVMHLPLAEMVGFPTQVSCKDISEKLKGTKVKLVLLGDIHDGREAVSNGIRFIYSGSPEITAANENPEKSFLLVKIGKGASGENTFDVERIPLHPRKQESIKVESEADLKTLREKMAGGPDGPLFHVEFDGKLVNAKERIAAIAEKAGARFRCFPVHTERQIATESVDRSGFRTSLKDIVDEDFADDPEAKEILLSMLSLPSESALEPVKKYLNRHGIKV